MLQAGLWASYVCSYLRVWRTLCLTTFWTDVDGTENMSAPQVLLGDVRSVSIVRTKRLLQSMHYLKMNHLKK